MGLEQVDIRNKQRGFQETTKNSFEVSIYNGTYFYHQNSLISFGEKKKSPLLIGHKNLNVLIFPTFSSARREFLSVSIVDIFDQCASCLVYYRMFSSLPGSCD